MPSKKQRAKQQKTQKTGASAIVVNMKLDYEILKKGPLGENMTLSQEQFDTIVDSENKNFLMQNLPNYDPGQLYSIMSKGNTDCMDEFPEDFKMLIYLASKCYATKAVCDSIGEPFSNYDKVIKENREIVEDITKKIILMNTVDFIKTRVKELLTN